MRLLTLFTLVALAVPADAQVLTASKILSGSGNDTATAIATDSQGNVFIAGTTTSGDFPLVKPLFAHLTEPALRFSADGKNFTASALSAATVNVLAASPDGKTALAGTSNGIFRSTDGGVSWAASQGAASGLIAGVGFDPSNPSNAYALASLTQGSVFYRSADGGATWQGTTLPSYGALSPARIVVDPQNAATIYATLSGTMYRSNDGGATWLQVLVSEARSPQGQAGLVSLAIAPSQPATIYAIDTFANLVKSLDSGATWQTMPAFADANNSNAIVVDPHDANVAWFTNATILVRTDDGGQTEQKVLQVGSNAWGAIAIDPNDSTHVTAIDYAAAFATFDRGATWTEVAEGQFQAALATPGGVFLGGSVTPALYLAKLDPTLTQTLFSTLIGPASGGSISLTVDAAGNPVVMGIASTADFPVTQNAWQQSFPSSTPGFVLKVRADGGALLYSTYLPGIQPHAAAFDSSGNVVIAGSASSSQNVAAGAYQSAASGACTRQFLFPTADSVLMPSHAFLLDLKSDGSRQVWSTYLTGSCSDSANAIVFDAAGNIVITGSTFSLDFPLTANAAVSKFPGGNTSGFLAKLAPDGSKLLYSTFFGSGTNNSGNALLLDAAGNAFVGGLTQTQATPGAFAPQNLPACAPIINIGPGLDNSYELDKGFVAKMTLDGANPAFLALLGGSCSTSVTSLSVDSAGNLWSSGVTASQNFPTMAPIGALGPGSGGFVAEMNPSGSNLLFASLTGMGAIASDGHQGVYLTETVSTATKPNGGGALTAHIDGSQPVAVAIDTLSAAGIQSGLEPPVFLPPSVAPGQLAVLNGRGIGPATRVNPPLTADGKFPLSAAGVQVMVNGAAVPLVNVQASQIEFQAPFELDGATAANIQVVYNGQTSNTFASTVTAQNLSLLAVVNADGTLNSAANPAKVGSVAALYITGIGQTTPSGVTGGLNMGPASPRLTPNFYVDGTTTTPAYFGPAPGLSTGAFQLNFVVPAPQNGAASDVVGLLGNGLSQISTPVYAK